MKKPEIAAQIQQLLNQASAADAADFFVSPHVARELLYVATYEPGPAMWVVNRSDVFDETLALLLDHPDKGIARRAADKIKARMAPPTTLPEAPGFDGQASQVPDFEVEEVLGHPQVALASILHFTYSLKQEHRASAALSATRRVLEFPPDWSREDVSRERLAGRLIEMLLDDPSALVRSYASRFPLLDGLVVAQAFARETNPVVRGRLLQHPLAPASLAIAAAEQSLAQEEDAFVDIVISLDARLPRELREKLVASGEKIPELAELFHRFQIVS
jgi:hypothetical protein